MGVNVMTREELYEDIQDINARLTHLEDTSLDTRDILIKLVKQGNQIIQFLKSFEADDITDEYISHQPPRLDDDKFIAMKDLIDTYLSKQKDLEEFEKELKKHKDKLTPGVVGKS